MRKLIYSSILLITLIVGLIFLYQPKNSKALYPEGPREPVEASENSVSFRKAEREWALDLPDEIKEVSRDEIATIYDLDSAKSIHRLLALSLADTLVGLKDETRRDRIRVKVKPLAEKFYLLEKAVEVNSLGEIKYQSLGAAEVLQIEVLLKTWSENSNLALEVDQVFASLNLLNCEHVPYLLRRWLTPESRATLDDRRK